MTRVTLFSLILCFSLLGVEHPSFADKDWCIRDRAHPPCNGAKGRCVMNSDGTQGGFVANTAKRKKQKRILGLFWTIDKPYIGIHAQVCGKSKIGTTVRIEGNTKINDSKIKGDVRIDGSPVIVSSQIRGKVRISDESFVESSSIWGDSEVVETGLWIRDKAKIKKSKLRGHVQVSGEAQVLSSQVTGKARISDKAIVRSNSIIDRKCTVGGNAEVVDSGLFGKIQVYGNAKVLSSNLNHYVKVYDNAKVERSSLAEYVQVYGNGKTWESSISGNVQVHDEGLAWGTLEGDLHITSPMAIPKPDQVFLENNEPLIGPLNECSTQEKNFLESFKKDTNFDETIKILRELSQQGRQTGESKGQVETLVDYFGEPDKNCPVCFEPVKFGATLGPCKHLVCRFCFNVIKSNRFKDPRCPLCRTNWDLERIFTVIQR